MAMQADEEAAGATFGSEGSRALFVICEIVEVRS